MKTILAITLLSITVLAEVKSKVITRATGREQVVSVGQCSSPVLGVTNGIYQSSFTKVSCREFETYQADIAGSFWNSKETRTSESTLSYKIDQEQITKSNYQYSNSNSGDAGVDLIIDGVEAALRITDALNQCNNARNTLAGVVIPVQQSKCAY